MFTKLLSLRISIIKGTKKTKRFGFFVLPLAEPITFPLTDTGTRKIVRHRKTVALYATALRPTYNCEKSKQNWIFFLQVSFQNFLAVLKIISVLL